jgi:FlaA1/EpsC-like NDP-sugar epimerase/EAL domain-containing protein (putative c-di-GMP-specific phosphodiesterase class I)
MMFNQLRRNLLEPINSYLMIVDALIFLVTPTLALFVRLDGWIWVDQYSQKLALTTIIFATLKLLVLTACGFYRRYWRFAGIDELAYLALLTLVFTLVQSTVLQVINWATHQPLNLLPHSLPLLDGLFSFLLLGIVRFSIPCFVRMVRRQSTRYPQGAKVLVFGAGRAGISLVREMQQHPDCGFRPVGFADDDPRKRNYYMCGLRVWGDRYQIAEIVQQQGIERVVIAIPSAAGQVIREIAAICQRHGIKTSTVPGIHELLDGRLRAYNIRDIRIEDLLRREPIETDFEAVSAFLGGKTVLITGAGGSIGSELCRQIYKCQPAVMVLVGHGENSVFTIQQELEGIARSERATDEAQGHTQLIPWIADLRSHVRINAAFAKFQPEVVFHAAAHKHVPLMEANPAEAVSNNVQGTCTLTEAALAHNVQHFVMISTDKAVNPTSIMGASKRAAEMVVLNAARKSGRAFVVVRFGNVLGSRGSVIPTFTRQIAAGGPVTVTHPNMCRYFMTIPEAVQLVLQAAMITHKGQVLMLNMGQPVRIVDLAADLIRLSGYEVGKDIDIVFTGTRPGEKLFEELLVPGETYEPTQHEKLLVVKNASAQLPERLEETIDMLCTAAACNNDTLSLCLLEQLVTGYRPTYPTTPPVMPDSLEAAALLEESNVIWLPSRRTEGSVIGKSTLNGHDDLRQAIVRQELRIFYQPIMLLEQDHILTGFEALLRWYHPQHGLIPSAAFISLADNTDIIYDLGWWGLQEVCTQLNTWHQQQPQTPIAVSVNLSAKQLLQPDFLARMQTTLQQTGVDVSQLGLEIPEQLISHNPDFAIPALLQLKGMGLHLQLDNFGHSALKTLAPLSEWIHIFDSLKIDRSRVQRLGTDQGVLDFFRGVLDLSQQFGMDMIAMGVETSHQVAQLKRLRCKYGQGYFFLKPISGKGADTLIGTRKFRENLPKTEGA